MSTPAQSETVARVAAMAAQIRARQTARPDQVTSRLDELTAQVTALEQLVEVLARSADPGAKAKIDAMYDAIERMLDAAGMSPARQPQRRHLRLVRDSALYPSA